MPATSGQHPPARPAHAGRVAAPNDLLGRASTQAFEAYFAAEQANLEALGQSADGDSEVAAFYVDMLAAQRRSLAELSFEIASMLPDQRIPAALASIVRQNRAHRARAMAASISTGPRASGIVAGMAAVAIAAIVLLTSREPALTIGSVIAPRPAIAAAESASAIAAITPQPGVLERSRIVAIYGHPYEPITGILGKYPPEEAALQTLRLAREAEAADGRPTVGALHLTVHVAQAQQTTDGTYLERLGDRGLRPWVEAARAHGLC